MSSDTATGLRSAGKAYRSHDYAVAFDLYSELGKQGHVDSQLMVAWMLLRGLGTAQDEEGAARWFERAAALGSPKGGFYFGRYLTKIGRHREALGCYRSAAQAENLPSIFWLGYSYARGQGTQVDLEQAYRYLKQAAKRGHLHAVRELGVLDMRGFRGNLWRLLGFFEFCAAVVGAFVLTLVNRESDRLRA